MRLIRKERLHPGLRPEDILSRKLPGRRYCAVPQDLEDEYPLFRIRGPLLHGAVDDEVGLVVYLLYERLHYPPGEVRNQRVLVSYAEHLLEVSCLHAVDRTGVLIAEDLIDALGIDRRQGHAVGLDELVESIRGVEYRLKHRTRHREGDDGVATVGALQWRERLRIVDDTGIGGVAHPVAGVHEREPALREGVERRLYLTIEPAVRPAPLDEELHRYREDVFALEKTVHRMADFRDRHVAVVRVYDRTVVYGIDADRPAELLPLRHELEERHDGVLDVLSQWRKFVVGAYETASGNHHLSGLSVLACLLLLGRPFIFFLLHDNEMCSVNLP